MASNQNLNLISQILENYKIEIAVIRIDGSNISVEINDPTPLLLTQIKKDLEQYSNIQIQPKYSLELQEKAYQTLRFENPSHYIDLDESLKNISENDTVSYGIKVVDLIHNLLIGESPYTSYFWEHDQFNYTGTKQITIEEANDFILNGVKNTALNTQVFRLIDKVNDQTVRLSTDVIQSAFNGHSTEIYSRSTAVFTVTAQNEVSVEFLKESDLEIDTCGIEIVLSKDPTQQSLDSEDLILKLDKSAVDVLKPSEIIKPQAIELFKKHFKNWDFHSFSEKFES